MTASKFEHCPKSQKKKNREKHLMLTLDIIQALFARWITKTINRLSKLLVIHFLTTDNHFSTSLNLRNGVRYKVLPYPESLCLTEFWVEVSPQRRFTFVDTTDNFYFTLMSIPWLPSVGYTGHKCMWRKQQSSSPCFTCQIQGACQEFP